MMTGWLKLTDEQRRETLAQAQLESGIVVKALEKDWWVTLTLNALFHSKYRQWLVFKGGTSLSKSWKLINRFSEDIDISLDPAAFGMPYKENPSKSYVEKLRRVGCSFTSNDLLAELRIQLLALGAAESQFAVEAAFVASDRPDTDPQTLYVRYKSLFDRHPYIAEEVKVEVSVRSMLTPFTQQPIRSLLVEFFPNDAYFEEPSQISVVEPKKTFLEKAFLLHEEFVRPDKGRIRYHRMSRHFYDLVCSAKSGVTEVALADDALYDQLIKHREWYSRLHWVDYTNLKRDTISFLPPDEVVDLYRSDYTTMLELMIYGAAPNFDEIIHQLKDLQGRFREKNK
jgi:hypothetical protein